MTSLKFNIYEEEDSPRSVISEFLLPVPLGHIFPKITAIRIESYRDDPVWPVEDEFSDNCDNGMFKWPAVTQLTLKGGDL